MKINKLKIKSDKLDLNLKFYFFLKYLVKSKLTEPQSQNLLERISLGSDLSEEISSFLKSISGKDKRDALGLLFEQLDLDLDVEMFVFGLKLYLCKDLLLKEAKISDFVNIDKLKNLNPLSVGYDKISVYKPYHTRVNGALLVLLFFEKIEKSKTNFMSEDAADFIKNLSDAAIGLKKQGLEPNQIFMLMFSESINQSIISDSGSNYEDRILMVLKKIGIAEENIKKIHDKDDSSTEFDFFFDLDGRSYGIGAKRTLRERYKQFIKTAQMSKIDVMIEITLGLDLNEEKARTINNNGVYLFVAEEIYDSRDFLRKLSGVYSAKDLNIKTLKSLK
jgi:hypothetical protein